MANIMQQFRAKNKVSRDGYDLNKRLCFSAKAGELLPTRSLLVMTGDTLEVGNKWETTTMPVNTAAYTRFKEYYEWYFVPLNLLWNKFNNWSVAMKNQNNVATSINGTAVLSDDHPYFTVAQIDAYLNRLADDETNDKNQFGFSRSENSKKLLSYLGYGDFYDSEYIENFAMSPWRLLAYQKVCQDWHRYSQWENSAPERFNLNYISGTPESLQIPISSIDISRQTMFDLQYCNWNKDLFMGVLPSSQFGDAASINIDSLESNPAYLYAPLSEVYSISGAASGTAAKINKDLGVNYLVDETNTRFGVRLSAQGAQALRTAMGITDSSFTILALRQAEALQKYKEITQSNPQDFPSQKDAHFDYRPNEAYSERSRLIHSQSADIEIRPVINQNITENSDSSLNSADIAGYGHVLAGGGKPKKFTADVDGILMCIYHVVPLLDYALPRIDPDNLKTSFTDYAMPEFDRIGMTQVPFAWLTNKSPLPLTSVTLQSKLLGYAPNYIEYKTDIDEVKGAFYNGGLEAWVAPITREYLAKYLFRNQTGNFEDFEFTGLDYAFFKVNPSIVNPIFSGQIADSSVSTDKFLVACYHTCDAVRPLSRIGLPF